MYRSISKLETDLIGCHQGVLAVGGAGEGDLHRLSLSLIIAAGVKKQRTDVLATLLLYFVA